MAGDVKLPSELIDAFSAGEGVLWLGAGCSTGSGLPTWEGLVNSMSQRLLKEPDISTFDLKYELDMLEIAELFRSAVGHNNYYAFLRNEIGARSLSNIPKSENSTLQAVAAFVNHLWPKPGLTVVSTNYDTLLEEHLLVAHGKKSRPIVTSHDIATMDPARDLNILKPNGDINHPDSIILTLADYCQFRARKPSFVSVLGELLAKKTILFVGYGLKDFTFNTIIGELHVGYGEFRRRAFLLTKDAQPTKKRVLKSLGVETIGVSSFDDIPFVLRAIANQQTTVELVIRKIDQLPKPVLASMATAKLLLIDDDVHLIETLQWLIRHYGWRAFDAVSDSTHAIEKIKKRQYDFIVTDFMMPGFNGIDVVKATRTSKRNRRAIVAVWSGYGEEDRCFAAGADHYFQKPTGIEQIVSTLYLLRRLRDGTY